MTDLYDIAATRNESQWIIPMEMIEAEKRLHELKAKLNAAEDRCHRLETLETEAMKWITARNKLSARCIQLGITSSIEDTSRWLRELDIAERAFRQFMDAWKENKE